MKDGKRKQLMKIFDPALQSLIEVKEESEEMARINCSAMKEE